VGNTGLLDFVPILLKSDFLLAVLIVQNPIHLLLLRGSGLDTHGGNLHVHLVLHVDLFPEFAHFVLPGLLGGPLVCSHVRPQGLGHIFLIVAFLEIVFVVLERVRRVVLGVECLLLPLLRVGVGRGDEMVLLLEVLVVVFEEFFCGQFVGEIADFAFDGVDVLMHLGQLHFADASFGTQIGG